MSKKTLNVSLFSHHLIMFRLHKRAEGECRVGSRHPLINTINSCTFETGKEIQQKVIENNNYGI